MRRQVFVLAVFAVGCTAAATDNPLAPPSSNNGGHGSNDSGSPSNGPPAFVFLRPKVDTLMVGQALQLTDTVEDQYGHVLKGVTLVWASHDSAVASITQHGHVVTRARGVDTVTASTGAIYGVSILVVRDTADTVHAAPDTVTLVGELVGGGDYGLGLDSTEQTLWGDSVTAYVPFPVRQHYYFRADNAAGDSIGVDSVATVDSAVFIQNLQCGDHPAGVCDVPDSGYSWCPPAIILVCAPSVGAANQPTTQQPWGYYAVWVTPAPMAAHVIRNPGSAPAFLLYSLPTNPAMARVRAVSSSTRPRSAGRAVWRAYLQIRL